MGECIYIVPSLQHRRHMRPLSRAYLEHWYLHQVFISAPGLFPPPPLQRIGLSTLPTGYGLTAKALRPTMALAH
jgi:hypothetical protein